MMMIINKKIELKRFYNYINFINIILVFLSLILLVCFLGVLEHFYIIHHNLKIRNEISKRDSKNKNEKLLENNNKNND
jgi:hypothetical protein